MNEAKCWSCARAYAKPDPDGCAFIRSGGVDISMIVSMQVSTKKEVNGRGYAKEWRRQTVTRCNDYINSQSRKVLITQEDMELGRQVRESKNRQKREQRKAERERVNALKPARYCKLCGGPIAPERDSRAIFCSANCAKKRSHNARKNIKKIPLEPKVCVICGKQYQPTRINQICCSSECTNENRSRLITTRRGERGQIPG